MKLNEIFIEEATNDLEIVRLAMIAELDAVNLYERMAAKAKNEDLKKVLLDVANEEKVHAEEFEQMLEELDPDYEESEEQAEKEVEDLKKESNMNLVDKIDKLLVEYMGPAAARNYKTPMQCMECGHKFKKKIGPKTFEVKCPKCKSTDVEVV